MFLKTTKPLLWSLLFWKWGIWNVISHKINLKIDGRKEWTKFSWILFDCHNQKFTFKVNVVVPGTSPHVLALCLLIFARTAFLCTLWALPWPQGSHLHGQSKFNCGRVFLLEEFYETTTQFATLPAHCSDGPGSRCRNEVSISLSPWVTTGSQTSGQATLDILIQVIHKRTELSYCAFGLFVMTYNLSWQIHP